MSFFLLKAFFIQQKRRQSIKLSRDRQKNALRIKISQGTKTVNFSKILIGIFPHRFPGTVSSENIQCARA